jgi:hypothetical protein
MVEREYSTAAVAVDKPGSNATLAVNTEETCTVMNERSAGARVCIVMFNAGFLLSGISVVYLILVRPCHREHSGGWGETSITPNKPIKNNRCICF